MNALISWFSSLKSARAKVEAWRQACNEGRPEPGLIHHSDRGDQYPSAKYQRTLHFHGMICNMSYKGDCWDNAPMESWFHILKTELADHEKYGTHEQEKPDILEYIEVFYNRNRLHSTLRYLTPAQV